MKLALSLTPLLTVCVLALACGSEPTPPAKLRGRKFVPCKDGESAPICRAGICSTLGYRC